MTEKEINEYVKEMKAYSKKISSSKSESIKFLVETGIYDKNGKLTKHYRRIK